MISGHSHYLKGHSASELENTLGGGPQQFEHGPRAPGFGSESFQKGVFSRQLPEPNLEFVELLKRLGLRILLWRVHIVLFFLHFLHGGHGIIQIPPSGPWKSSQSSHIPLPPRRLFWVRDYIGVIYIYRDTGKENGDYYFGFRV